MEIQILELTDFQVGYFIDIYNEQYGEQYQMTIHAIDASNQAVFCFDTNDPLETKVFCVDELSPMGRFNDLQIVKVYDQNKKEIWEAID
jgi:hypothetical protein